MNSKPALELLRRYSVKEAASVAGALCLIPENHHSLARLETIGHCCAAQVPRGGQRANRSNVQKLVTALRQWTGSADDPAQCPATQGFPFHGGTYVFVAPTPESLFSLQILGPMSLPSADGGLATRRRLHGLISFCCQVTQRCLLAAGLPRNLAVPEFTRTMGVPPTASLRALQEAVTFSHEEWLRLARLTEVAEEDLEALCIDATPQEVPDHVFLSRQLGQTPFVRHEDTIVLAAPHRLCDAVVDRARALFASSSEPRKLAREFHERALIRVTESLGTLGLNWMFSEWRLASDLTQSLVSDLLFGWDENRRAYVAMASDACANESWNADEVGDNLEQGLSLFEDLFGGVQPTSVEQFNLLVVVPLAGTPEISIPATDFRSNGAVLTGADLESLAQGTATREKQGLLARYVRARSKFEENGIVRSWGELDAIEAWRLQNYRFPRDVGMLAIQCDMARPLRERALDELAEHSVPNVDGETLVQVQRAEDATLPLYMPRHRDVKSPRLVAEIGDHHVWLILDLNPGFSDVRWALEFLRMSGFWVCQFAEFLESYAPAGRPTIVDLCVQETATNNESSASYRITSSPGHLRVTTSPAFVERYGADNSAEREYAFDVVRALAESWGAEAPKGFDEACDRVAPLGPKRMLHAFFAERVPELAFKHDLPPPAFVHPADLAEIAVDALLPHVPTTMGDDAAKVALNRAVEDLYQRLLSLLNTYDVEQLRRRLILNNESLLAALAEEEIMLASQLACAGDSEELLDRLHEDVRHRSASAVATRFLMELVTACPSGGGGHVGTVDIQRLLALASEIIALGMSSDILRYQLAEVSVRIDDSGYPFVEQRAYDGASLSAYDAAFTERMQYERQRTGVPRAIGTESGGLSPADETLLDLGMRAEFDMTFNQFREAFGLLVGIAAERAPIASLPCEELVARMQKDLNLREGVAEVLMSKLTLGPRKDFLKPPAPFASTDFLKPPAPFASTDVYPWRFNRRLSVLQRPLLQVEDVIQFSTGHTCRASAYLLNLIRGDRFKADSEGMKRAMGKLKKNAGDEFNDEVGDLLWELGYSCRVRVKKFQGRRMARDNGSDLGDVDVIAVDETNRVIFGVECKDLEMDRTPHEVRNDLEDLFLGRGDQPSIQAKHLERIGWLKSNLQHVVAELGLSGADWAIVPILVLSRQHRSPLLGHSKMAVVSYGGLLTDRRLPR